MTSLEAPGFRGLQCFSELVFKIDSAGVFTAAVRSCIADGGTASAGVPVTGPPSWFVRTTWRRVGMDIRKQRCVERVAGSKLITEATLAADHVRKVVRIARRWTIRPPQMSGDPAPQPSNTHGTKRRTSALDLLFHGSRQRASGAGSTGIRTLPEVDCGCLG